MAHVIEKPLGSIQSSTPEKDKLPAGEPVMPVSQPSWADNPAPGEEAPGGRKYFGMPSGAAVVIGIVVLAALVAVGIYFAGFSQRSAESTVASGAPPVSQAATPAAAAPTSKVQLSASDIKEMKARDDYAANLSKFLHVKMPDYKNVKIYADSWAGTKAPAKTPLADIKSRTGDNLMLVFWSPEAGTARSLAAFTKSQGAQEAVNAGFAEFQFVDPDTYCYATVVPVTGVGGVVCGIR
ncbi:hypothetical protein [Acidicapsa acidisoli]|uniref:hypothetical protein n=1 Tax=Acidicapsa acidisoli TaxID=1615681 RepID=UPI0021E090C7|nr:hypothetical protein [Acidicapsa acidisoli]